MTIFDKKFVLSVDNNAVAYDDSPEKLLSRVKDFNGKVWEIYDINTRDVVYSSRDAENIEDNGTFLVDQIEDKFNLREEIAKYDNKIYVAISTLSGVSLDEAKKIEKKMEFNDYIDFVSSIENGDKDESMKILKKYVMVEASTVKPVQLDSDTNDSQDDKNGNGDKDDKDTVKIYKDSSGETSTVDVISDDGQHAKVRTPKGTKTVKSDEIISISSEKLKK